MNVGDIVTVTGMVRPPEGTKVRIWKIVRSTFLCYDLDAKIPDDYAEARSKAYWLKPANLKESK